MTVVGTVQSSSQEAMATTTTNMDSMEIIFIGQKVFGLMVLIQMQGAGLILLTAFKSNVKNGNLLLYQFEHII